MSNQTFKEKKDAYWVGIRALPKEENIQCGNNICVSQNLGKGTIKIRKGLDSMDIPEVAIPTLLDALSKWFPAEETQTIEAPTPPPEPVSDRITMESAVTSVSRNGTMATFAEGSTLRDVINELFEGVGFVADNNDDYALILGPNNKYMYYDYNAASEELSLFERVL